MSRNPSVTEVRQLSRSLLSWLGGRLRAVLGEVKVQRRTCRLRLCETVSLGEKCLVAVIEFEDQRFLLAASPQNISLLQSLGPIRSEER